MCALTGSRLPDPLGISDVHPAPRGPRGVPFKLDHPAPVAALPAGHDGNQPPGPVTEQDLARGAVSGPRPVRDVIDRKGHLKSGALAGVTGRHEGTGTRRQLPGNSRRGRDLDFN